MANCEENSCANVQSAICLHCNRCLCAPHIVAHGIVLLEQADELCEQINKVAEDLNVSLKQIDTARSETVDAIGVWRQKEIDKIEDKYAEKVQAIESRQAYLIELENKLSQRLAKDAREPLERMQVQKSANSQVIQAVRQTIADVKQESQQLEWDPIESLNQFSSFNIENIPISTPQHIQSDDQHQYESNLSKNHVGKHSTMYSVENQRYPPYQPNQSSGRNLSSLMPVAPVPNTFSNVPCSSMNSSGFSTLIRPQFEYNQTRAPFRPHWSQPPSASATSVHQFCHSPTTITVASSSVPWPPTHFCKELVAAFMNVSSSSNHFLDDFITNNLNRAAHVNNMMILLLSFLEAWHSKNAPTVFNERVLSYHIFTVKKYIDSRDHEITVLAAIVAFINSCGYDEIKSGRIMTILLHQFFDHKCITKASILDWYQNGASYGCENFHRVKLWAKPFIDQLNPDV